MTFDHDKPMVVRGCHLLAAEAPRSTSPAEKGRAPPWAACGVDVGHAGMQGDPEPWLMMGFFGFRIQSFPLDLAKSGVSLA